MDAYQLRPIGWVESTLVDRESAPRQGDEGAPDAWLVFDPAVAPGLRDLAVGEDVIVLTWLDRGRRDELLTHPRDDLSRSETGVFSTRSPIARIRSGCTPFTSSRSTGHASVCATSKHWTAPPFSTSNHCSAIRQSAEPLVHRLAARFVCDGAAPLGAVPGSGQPASMPQERSAQRSRASFAMRREPRSAALRHVCTPSSRRAAPRRGPAPSCGVALRRIARGNERTVGDADGRYVHRGTEVRCEPSPSRVVETRGVDEQHVRPDVQSGNRTGEHPSLS